MGCAGIVTWFSKLKISIEVPLLIVYFGFLTYSGIVMNLTTYRTCYTLEHYPKENCSRLGIDDDNATIALEKKVQSTVSNVVTITEMIPSSLPILISLAIGSWSDKHGRRPAMIFILSCLCIGFTTTTILIAFEDINPYYMMFSAIPTMLCGGPLTFFSVALSYVNDVATDETRGIKMAIFEVITIFCTCFGTLTSIVLFNAGSYIAVGAFSAVLMVIATIYTYFFIPESLKVDNDNTATIANVFTWTHLTDLFRTAGTKRPNNKRFILLSWLCVIFIMGLLVSGEMNIKTLYLREDPFKWSMADKNVFTSWASVVGMLGTILYISLFYKKLKINEAYLCILGFIGGIGSSIMYALATSNGYIYATVFVGLFGGAIYPLVRTAIAQILPREEMGKIFALISVVNSLLQMISSFGYNFIYAHTGKGVFNYVSVGLDTLCIILIMIIITVSKRSNKQENSSKGSDLEAAEQKLTS